MAGSPVKIRKKQARVLESTASAAANPALRTLCLPRRLPVILCFPFSPPISLAFLAIHRNKIVCL